MSTIIHQPAIHIEIPSGIPSSTETTDGFYRPREWQERCFDKLRGSRNWIINAPMAAGKSFVICAIAADMLRQDQDLKVIIAVPQTIIGAGFRANRIELPGGTRINWSIRAGYDLCRETLPQSSARVLEFLEGLPSQEMMARVVVCTHATLVRAFGSKKSAFKNVFIVIDEAHHIKHGGEDELEIEVENQMGALVKYALMHPEFVRLGLATATFFRGDRAPIVADASRFTRFELAYDEYLATCRYLRTFSYNFVIHAASFVDPLSLLFEQRIGKTLVYIPSVNSYSSVGTKTEDVDSVICAIAGSDNPMLVDADQPVMRVKRGDTWVRVVNLADPNFRKEKKEAIVAAHERAVGDDIDVIIALGMLKEGANWRWADREVIIGQRGSLTEVVQMIGRLFRDVEGKSQVEVYQLLPFAFDQTDKAAVREKLNKYMTVLLLSMLLENVMNPVTLPTLKGIGEGERGPRINYLREACADHSEAVAVLEEIRREIIEARSDGDSFQEVDKFKLRFKGIVADVLSAHRVVDCQEEIAEQISRMFNRRTVALAGLNVGEVNTDFIREDPFGCLLQYASAACGIKTFREFLGDHLKTGHTWSLQNRPTR